VFLDEIVTPSIRYVVLVARRSMNLCLDYFWLIFLSSKYLSYKTDRRGYVIRKEALITLFNSALITLFNRPSLPPFINLQSVVATADIRDKL